MLHNILIIAGFWLLYFTLLTLIWWLKEVKAWSPEPFGVLDSYPWICRKCLTTWTLIASYLSVGIIIGNPAFAFFGVLLGAGTGYAMHYTEKERTVEE